MVDNVIQIKSGIKINADASVKNIIYVKKIIFGRLYPVTCSCENGKYLASIIDDSVIICDEIIDAVANSYDEETKKVTTNFNEKNIICETKRFYILLAFLLIAIALL